MAAKYEGNREIERELKRDEEKLEKKEKKIREGEKEKSEVETEGREEVQSMTRFPIAHREPARTSGSSKWPRTPTADSIAPSLPRAARKTSIFSRYFLSQTRKNE